MSILEIDNLKIGFDPRNQAGLAVKGVSLGIEENSLTALVGPSGCGKTATLLSICRLSAPAFRTGRILYRGRDGSGTDTLSVPETALKRIRGREIGMVFQDPGSSLNPVLTAGEHVAETHRAHFRASKGESRRAAVSLLEAVRVGDAERVYASYPHQLSGGLRQRVLIAAALAARPRLLLADEPTTALDAVTEREVLDLLDELRRKFSMTLFWVTHNLDLARRYSDAVYVMENGALLERLTRADGFRPRTDFARRLLAADLALFEPKKRIA